MELGKVDGWPESAAFGRLPIDAREPDEVNDC
jgi:hypothetical protein